MSHDTECCPCLYHYVSREKKREKFTLLKYFGKGLSFFPNNNIPLVITILENGQLLPHCLTQKWPKKIPCTLHVGKMPPIALILRFQSPIDH